MSDTAELIRLAFLFEKNGQVASWGTNATYYLMLHLSLQLQGICKGHGTMSVVARAATLDISRTMTPGPIKEDLSSLPRTLHDYDLTGTQQLFEFEIKLCIKQFPLIKRRPTLTVPNQTP